MGVVGGGRCRRHEALLYFFHQLFVDLQWLVGTVAVTAMDSIALAAAFAGIGVHAGTRPFECATPPYEHFDAEAGQQEYNDGKAYCQHKKNCFHGLEIIRREAYIRVCLLLLPKQDLNLRPPD